MPEQDTTTEAAAESTGDSTEATATEATTETAAGEAALGDAGKKALDAMKAELATAKSELSEWRAAGGDPKGLARIQQERAELAKARERLQELEAAQAKAEGREAEYAKAQESQRVKDEALAAANDRILKAEVRAAAASKLTDPQDALRFLDLSDFEVGSDGEVDASRVAKAIDDLIASKPYLAAQGGQRFQGSADGGARNDATKVAQLGQADLSRMTPDQIADAEAKGQFDDLLGRT